MKIFRFTCNFCAEEHEGIPSFNSEAPLYYYQVPEEEREDRTYLDTDTCVVDDEFYFVKACLELPVCGYEESFSVATWVSLSKKNFDRFQELYELENREDEASMFAWFSAWVWPFEIKEHLKTMIHFRNDWNRPLIELEATEHPLAIAQREGITEEMLIRICQYYMHGLET